MLFIFCYFFILVLNLIDWFINLMRLIFFSNWFELNWIVLTIVLADICAVTGWRTGNTNPDVRIATSASISSRSACSSSTATLPESAPFTVHPFIHPLLLFLLFKKTAPILNWMIWSLQVMDSETGLLTAGRDKTARVWSLQSQVYRRCYLF